MADELPNITPGIRTLYESIEAFTRTGDLGVIAAVTKTGRAPRFVLTGRINRPGQEPVLVPLGYLVEGLDREIERSAALWPPLELTLDEATATAPPPMDDFTATMIAEGAMEADEDAQLRAWQHLEDTGLGYRLQGWFGRRLRDLIEQGAIRPRKEAA